MIQVTSVLGRILLLFCCLVAVAENDEVAKLHFPLLFPDTLWQWFVDSNKASDKAVSRGNGERGARNSLQNNT